MISVIKNPTPDRKSWLDLDKYGRRIATDVKIAINGYTFCIDLVIDQFEDTTDPSMIVGRNFLLALKCNMNFGLGEMQKNVGLLQEDKDFAWLL